VHKGLQVSVQGFHSSGKPGKGKLLEFYVTPGIFDMISFDTVMGVSCTT